jgi:hypothetical protein
MYVELKRTFIPWELIPKACEAAQQPNRKKNKSFGFGLNLGVGTPASPVDRSQDARKCSLAAFATQKEITLIPPCIGPAQRIDGAKRSV